MPLGYRNTAAAYPLPMETTTDLLNRRLRFAPPTPTIGRIALQETDIEIFEAIFRHGALPTRYLYEFVRGSRKDYTRFQKRLTDLYNGDKDGSYLTRPPRQFNAYEARYQDVVYGLTPRVLAFLAATRRDGLGCAKPRSNDFVHDLMAACATASIELAARKRSIEFISREDILGDDKLALLIYGKNLAPDDLFGFRYPDGGKRYFAFEADRGTERITTSDASQTAFGGKILAYLGVLRGRLFHEHWGITNLSILTLTSMPGRAQNLADFVREQQDPKFTERFCFAVAPTFGARYAASAADQFWKMPKTILTDLVENPWETPLGTRDISVP